MIKRYKYGFVENAGWGRPFQHYEDSEGEWVEYNEIKGLLDRTAVYVIEELLLSPDENSIAHRYNPCGYVDTEEKAADFCSKGKIYTSKDCWSLRLGPLPQYRYKKLEIVKP